MLLNEEGLAVVRVQIALRELGFDLGPAGADGFFGPATGTAVSLFKQQHALTPSDPVVGVGTMTKLDDLFFVDPPILDPAFLEFSPLVADKRVDPLVANVLAGHLAAPFGSWRRMAAMFALNSLNSGELACIVAAGRFGDLRNLVLQQAAPVQPNGETSAQWFERERLDALNARGWSGATFDFQKPDGDPVGIILLSDELLRGKARTIRAATGQEIREETGQTVIHELTHFRNLRKGPGIRLTPDSDSGTYFDTALAAQLTGTMPRPTVVVLLEFLEEISARHVEWHVRQETQGNPFAGRFLTDEQFAAAVVSYLHEFPRLFDAGNDYVTTLNQRPDDTEARLRQAALWLRRLQEFSFTDNADDEATVQQRLQKAASVCDFLAAGGALVDPPDPQGLFPLVQDFP
ncbi:peptidoglycan-binding protein [Nonomuraea sp. NPDC050536]|uniref:peptidoglycan-binding protein n=1 Tax=Nonomuraea sp. NPDC050536 TaxID=3364366 RepID=UPI0037CBCF96